MRVVAGSSRGRRLKAPVGNEVRPTTDRVREATFNALHSMGAVVDAVVLDLFAGSGALGIEAVSRGAASVTFVEVDRAAQRCIEENLEATGLTGTVVPGPGERVLARPPDVTYDLVLCDPPYAYDGWPELWRLVDPWVAPDGVVVTESDHPIEPPAGWQVARSRRYGGTVVDIHVRAADEPRITGVQS
jgi:16S rRNA (guanine966-N2)-methyltransferase